MAKKTIKVTITSTITIKKLQAAQGAMEGSYQQAREAFFKAVNSSLKGKVKSNGQVVNAVCYALSKGKTANLQQARDKKTSWLKNVEKLNNFLSSWVEITKKGDLKLLAVNKKMKSSSGLKRGSSSSQSSSSRVVTFKKSEAIAMLDKIASAKKGVSRKAKALANQLAEELEG